MLWLLYYKSAYKPEENAFLRSRRRDGVPTAVSVKIVSKAKLLRLF